MKNLFNPDYLHHLASKYRLTPSKNYGQNYLLDEEVINKILELANLSKADTVVEVGPGFGVLTFPLAERAGRVVSFEIEKKLQPYWNEHGCHLERSERSLSDSTIMTEISRTARNDKRNIEVVWGNVLKMFSVIASEAKQSSPSGKDRRVASLLAMTPYKVVANLPYQITSAVIRMFLEADKSLPAGRQAPEAMVLMVQKEVAERICAAPGDMSLLSISVQYYAEPKFEFIVPRTSFWPSPRVDSAVITLSLRAKRSNLHGEDRHGLRPRDDKAFFNLVKIGFANRRKLLHKNLEPLIGKKNKEKLSKIFSELGLLPTVRAQELSVEDWQRLFAKLRVIPDHDPESTIGHLGKRGFPPPRE